MFRRTVVLCRISLIFTFGLITTACLRELPEEPSITPLPAGFIDENNRLVEEVWQLAEVIEQGEVINFTTIAPIHLGFNPEGTLGVSVTDCNSYSLKVIVEPNEKHYQLFSGTSTAIDCGELRQSQTERVGNALRSTNRYEIRGERLILIGEDVQLVLDPDLKNVFREDYGSLPQDEGWYLAEIIDNEKSISFETIRPIIIYFQRMSNWLYVHNTSCPRFAYQFVPNGAPNYQLIFDDVIIPDPDCVGEERQEFSLVIKAIEATTRFRFEGDQLHLLGDGVEVILAPEPVPGNTTPSTSPVATPTP